jgi:methionyl-tRNA formyltransferase
MRAVFFCGHNSPYGLAHLKPILRSFDAVAVVVATEERWADFGQKLVGQRFSYPSPLFTAVDDMIDVTRSVARKLAGWCQADKRLSPICRNAGIPVWRTGDVNDPDFVRSMSECAPDVILSAAYPQMLSGDLLETARRGGINFHPALLPRNRGAHPHYWAIAKGDAEGGVTAHWMTERLDAGPIVAQIHFPISTMYYSEYYRAIIEHTPALVCEVESNLASGTAPIPQTGESSFNNNDREIQHRVSWSLMHARVIHNLIRTDKAFCTYRGHLVWIRRAELLSSNRNITKYTVVEPGTVVDIDGSYIVVAAADGYIGISSLSDGGCNLSFGRWVARHRARIGERFS